MNTLRVLSHMARADFLERVRRYSFLIILALTLFLGYSVIRGDLYLELDNYRGALNSAWVGAVMAVSASLIISLFGFYIVKNTIERDIETGVGQIIATTPISRATYLLGKWLSNWAVLSALVALLVLAAVVMQLLGRESSRIDLTALLLPFLLLPVPAMAFVAALAVVFETIPWLRGGLGNVLYFFLFSFGLSLPFITGSPWLDWSGIMVVQQSMAETLRLIHPGYSGSFAFTSQPLPEGGLRMFLWTGVTWTSGILLARGVWLGGALCLVAMGSVVFNRFDPSREKSIARRSRKRGRDEVSPVPPQAAKPPISLHLTPLPERRTRSGFARVLRAEILLLVKGQPWWWYAGVAVGIVGGLLASIEDARRGWLPAAWLWPILIWSVLGTREQRYGTGPLVFSSPHPLWRQLPASWLAGFLITLICGSGVGMHLLWSGHWPALGAWVAGAAFVPSFALASGVWTRTRRPFEALYLLLWYMGPLHPAEMPQLDFMAAGDAALAQGAPMFFAFGALLLAGLALLGRWQTMHAD